MNPWTCKPVNTWKVIHRITGSPVHRFTFLLLCFLVLTACGYQFVGITEQSPFTRPAPEARQAPAREAPTLAVPFFVNATEEPLIEEEITPVVLREFVRDARLRLVGSQGATWVLHNRITSYREIPLSFDADQNVLEYRVVITVNAHLENQVNRQTLWKGEVSAAAEYPVTPDVMETRTAKRQAVAEVARNLGEELVDRVMEGY